MDDRQERLSPHSPHHNVETPTMPSVLDLSPQQAHQRLVAILKEKSYQKRKVVLSSGRESDFYVDGKQWFFTSDPIASISTMDIEPEKCFIL